MKRVWVILLAAALLCLAGCGTDEKKVAFLLYDATDTFISEMMEGMEAAMPPGIAYGIYDAGNSQARQNQQIVELLEEGVDTLIINAVDRLACSAIVEKCSNEGVHVIFFNREPLEDAMQAEHVFYVGAAADSLGEKQADLVAQLFGNAFPRGEYDHNGDGVVQLVILKGEQGHQDAEKRTENCVSRLKALGYSVEILATEVANWTRGEGYDAMRKLYGEHGEGIELVFSNNDDMALGAIDYLLEARLFRPREGAYGQPIVIVGVDGTEVGLEAIAGGLMYGTVHNDGKTQGDAILRLLQSLLAGGDLRDYPYAITGAHYIYIDGNIIMKENVQEYIDQANLPQQ